MGKSLFRRKGNFNLFLALAGGTDMVAAIVKASFWIIINNRGFQLL